MISFGLVALRPRWTRRRDGQRSSLVLLFILLTLTGAGSAQLIPIRTVPLAQGDQFLIYPSNNLGMGGVSVALADSLLDPFRNPAMGARLAQARLFASPTIYRTTQETGGGATLPVAGFGRAGAWFGAVSVAVQQVDGSRPMQQLVFAPGVRIGPPVGFAPPPVSTGGESHGNQYGLLSLGRALNGTGLSIGGSLQWSRLHGLDGGDLLYQGGQSLSETGHGLDLRVGLLKDWPGNRSLEALVVHNRFRMTHDVTYIDQLWDPGLQQFVQSTRFEHALDRATTSAFHVAYQRPLAATDWRIGWVATLNLVSQPRIAENEIVTLPRDQGHATAADVGVGFSKTRGPATFAADILYEPIWSTTGGVAQAPVVVATGDTIQTGGRTVTNRFRFSNVVLRLGVSHEVALAGLPKAVAFQLGLGLRSVRYHFDQTDLVAAARQEARSNWVEWTPTWGLTFRFAEFDLRYRGRVANGMGRPMQGIVVGVFNPVADVAPGMLIVAPDQTLRLAGVSTVTHQISLSLPLR